MAALEIQVKNKKRLCTSFRIEYALFQKRTKLGKLKIDDASEKFNQK